MVKSEPHTCRSSLVGSMGSIMKRQIIVLGDVGLVPLSQGKIAIVDAADVPFLQNHNWYFAGGYAKTNMLQDDGKRHPVRMHRLLIQTPTNLHTDHVNGDRLDNRRQNLRVATASENLCNRGAQVNNTTGLKGVHFFKRTGRWQAHIKIQGKRIHLGYHSTPEEAHAAYAKASAAMHREFGRLA